MSIGSIWIIASFSFVVALSGALVPGPLLTYTIMKTLEVRGRGSAVGALIIVGHALLESVLVILLLAGFASLLKNTTTIRIIGSIGGAVLVYLGARLMIDVFRHRIQNVFEESSVVAHKQVAAQTIESARSRLPHPIVGGIIVSMSNPYWWVWWASIGLAFMAQYNISFQNWPGLLAFMAGHEAGDLAVYWLVSILVAIGRNRLRERSYRWVLFGCAIVMIGFGLYLGISSQFAQPSLAQRLNGAELKFSKHDTL